MSGIVIAVLAHNEERRIGRCLDSLLADAPGAPIHVLVNGSSDGTEAIVRRYAAVHDAIRLYCYPEGGKARSWNRFVLDELERFAPVHIFVDGDAEVAPGSIAALAAAFAANPAANAASALPLNGRRAAHYRAAMLAEHGLFGDLYALSGAFLARMKARGLRLPEDLVGDDGLIGALAKTDLGHEDEWDDARVVPCTEAGFLCEPASPLRPWTLRHQYRRMVSYSVRHFQGRIVSAIMREEGPEGLPPHLSDLYGAWLGRFAPRAGLAGWFDRAALSRMAAQAGARRRTASLSTSSTSSGAATRSKAA